MPATHEDKNDQRSSLRIRLLITYLVITVALVFIATGSIARLMWQFTEDEFTSSCGHSVRQLQDSVDSQMLTMHEIAQNMQSDTALLSANILRDGKLLTTYNAINRYSLSIDMVENYFLFYSSNLVPYVLSERTLINKNFFDRINAWLPLTLKDLDSYLNLTEEHAVLPLETTTGRYLANIYLLSEDPNSRRAVLFLVNLDQIRYSIERVFPDELAYFRLTAPDGTLLFEEKRDRNVLYTYSAQSSSTISLGLEIGICRPKVYSVVGAYGKMLVLYLVISVVLGILLSSLMAKKVYAPIFLARNRIVSGAESHSFNRNRYSEISDIEDVYRNVSSEKARLASLVHVQTDALMSRYLDALLSGRKLSNEDMRALSEWEWGEGPMLLLHCALDQLRAFLNTYDPANRTAIEQELMETFAPLDALCLRRIVSPMSDSRQWLMLLRLKEGVTRPQVRECIVEIMQDIPRLTEQTVTITIGPFFLVCEDIPEQYAVVQRVSQLRLQAGWNSLLDAEAPPVPTRLETDPPDAPALKNACLSGNIAAAQAELEKFFPVLYETSDLLSFKQAYFNLLATMRRISEESGYAEADMPDTDFEPETIDEARDTLLRVMEDICAGASEEKLHLRAHVATAAMEYLRAHHADPMLGTDEIADALHVSKNYLNACFKEKTGQSISVALDDIRMEQSRTLLKKTDMLVKDIVLAVGYVDVNNYIRKFKRLEGITPLQYRKIQQG